MRLPQPFLRLAVVFDVTRMQQEIEQIPESAWAEHPNGIPGNSSIRLISVEGGENDDVNGRMAPTAHLVRSPYLRQVLASFGVVWGRSRLMRLAPRSSVPQHADINHHWFTRVRLHIPIVTRPEVRFHCGEDEVHMGAGEAWLFDNWRQHRVENATDYERIHLVADTSGGSSFWQFVARSQVITTARMQHHFDADRDATPLTERAVRPPVMPPAEVDLLIHDLRSELNATDDVAGAAVRVARYSALLDGFCKDWRQLYALYGDAEMGRHEFVDLRDKMRETSQQLSKNIVAKTNRVDAHLVLDARVLRPMLAPHTTLRRPVFIVAAPRSGSTLLYETLATHAELCTLGGEAHLLIEGIPELQLGSPGVSSNRLDAALASDTVRQKIEDYIAARAIDAHGRPLTLTPQVRLLEKTPKNALRIPFLNRLFPDAFFIFLWREPLGNLGSIMEAWKSGDWKTYNGLPGFDGPWSLILPPDWSRLNGRPLAEIAAFQWESTNRIVMDDLASIPAERRLVVAYDDFLADPAGTTQRLCDGIGIPIDSSLRQRVAAPLPLSRYTQTPPAAGKWRKNALAIERVLPGLEPTWKRLQAWSLRARTPQD